MPPYELSHDLVVPVYHYDPTPRSATGKDCSGVARFHYTSLPRRSQWSFLAPSEGVILSIPREEVAVLPLHTETDLVWKKEREGRRRRHRLR